jgi:uncharacterized damage-inducible protein DinB
MIALHILREFFTYNYWARDRQLDACAALRPDQLQCPLGSSFSSLQDTLVHLLGAEWLWLERLRGRSPGRLPATREFPSLEAILDRWRIVERAMLDYLDTLNDELLASNVSYKNFSGETWRYPVWLVLLHILNHQTYHRGQVATLLRQLGAEPPAVDLLVADDWGVLQGMRAAEAVARPEYPESA